MKETRERNRRDATVGTTRSTAANDSLLLTGFAAYSSIAAAIQTLLAMMGHDACGEHDDR